MSHGPQDEEGDLVRIVAYLPRDLRDALVAAVERDGQTISSWARLAAARHVGKDAGRAKPKRRYTTKN